MKQTYNVANATPEAFISIKKSRLQTSNNKYYLISNQEFEIELFNPLQEKICCSIKLNDKEQNYQLVLYPGQRVFLERFLDDSKKFKFDTYEVENTKEASNAIALNGKIEIKFFKEKPITIQATQFPKFDTTTYPSTPWNQPGVIYYSSTPNINYNDTLGKTTNFFSKVSDTKLRTNSSILNKMDFSFDSKSIETGRVEKGNTSNQQFEDSNDNFNIFSFHSINIDLLPISLKPENLKVIYCTNCRKKQKNNWKFCPSCGEAYVEE